MGWHLKTHTSVQISDIIIFANALMVNMPIMDTKRIMQIQEYLSSIEIISIFKKSLI